MSAAIIDMPPPPPAGDTDAALDFLGRWHGGDPWVVITIHPETGVTTRRDFPPGETGRARAFIDAAQGRLNCYTPVNLAAPGATSPKKPAMRAARALWVDADLHDTGGAPEALLARLRSFDPPPSIIIFSGGGFWALWLLAAPYNDGGDWRERVERISAGFHLAAGASPTCATINRLMRLPGTVNVPGETKRARGRVPALAYVVEADWGRRWSFDTDRLPSLPAGPGDGGVPDNLMSLVKTGDAKKYGGDRSRLVFYVACGLARVGWTDRQIADLLINPANGVSAHVREQPKPAEYALKQAQNARNVVGAEVRSEAAQVEQLNSEYAVVAHAGKVAILREFEDEEGLPAFALMSADAFRLWLANRPTIMRGGRPVAVADFWLRHPERRQHAGIGFMPENARPGWFNLWRGFAVEPSAAGSCELFLAHLRDNVAQGDPALFRWVEGWLADIVQHPGRKCGTSLVLIGKQGVGKTIVGKTMMKLLGHHYVGATRPRYITGQFNSHLVRCLLLHADEGFWAGDKQAEGVLKDLVTGDKHLIEFKGFEPVTIRNYIRLLVTSNEHWVVPAGMAERRHAVLTVGSAHVQDRAYFAAIEEQLESGGYEALLYHLLSVDLSKVDVSRIPTTDVLLDQKLESLSQIERWWLTTLREGRLPGGCEEANTCPVKALYQRYLDHSAMVHSRNQRAIETQLGIALRRLMPLSKGEKPKLSRVRGWYRQFRDGPGQSGYVYQLPSLVACREHFVKLIGQDINWEDELPDFPDGDPMAWDADGTPEVDWEKDALPIPPATDVPPTSPAVPTCGSEVVGESVF
jgi:hypothetical protein